MYTRSGRAIVSLEGIAAAAAYKIPKKPKKVLTIKLKKSTKKKNDMDASESDSFGSSDDYDELAQELENIKPQQVPSLHSLDSKAISKFLEESQYFLKSPRVVLSECISMETLEMLSIMSEISLMRLMQLNNPELCEFLKVYDICHNREYGFGGNRMKEDQQESLPKDLKMLHMNSPNKQNEESWVLKLEEYYTEFSHELKHPINQDLYTRHELKKLFTNGLLLEELRFEANKMYFQDFQQIFAWAHSQLHAMERKKKLQQQLEQGQVTNTNTTATANTTNTTPVKPILKKSTTTTNNDCVKSPLPPGPSAPPSVAYHAKEEKEKGREKERENQCWNCWQYGHFASQCHQVATRDREGRSEETRKRYDNHDGVYGVYGHYGHYGEYYTSHTTAIRAEEERGQNMNNNKNNKKGISFASDTKYDKYNYNYHHTNSKSNTNTTNTTNTTSTAGGKCNKCGQSGHYGFECTVLLSNNKNQSSYYGNNYDSNGNNGNGNSNGCNKRSSSFSLEEEYQYARRVIKSVRFDNNISNSDQSNSTSTNKNKKKTLYER